MPTLSEPKSHKGLDSAIDGMFGALTRIWDMRRVSLTLQLEQKATCSSTNEKPRVAPP